MSYLIGFGHSYPSTIRRNDSDIFNYLKEHKPPNLDLFKGYNQRYVLKDEESIDEHVKISASNAINDACLEAGEIDAILGYVTCSEFQAPNSLTKVHRDLKLKKACPVIPIQSEYCSFNYSLILSQSMIASGFSKNILLVCGSNWSKYIDYNESASISISDGAGASIIGKSRKSNINLKIKDWSNHTFSDLYGSMTLSDRKKKYSIKEAPYLSVNNSVFSLNETGERAFRKVAIEGVPNLVKGLLKNHSISAEEITIIGHQTSSV